MTPSMLKIEIAGKTSYINLNTITSIEIIMSGDQTTDEEFDYHFTFRGPGTVVKLNSYGEHAAQIIEKLDRLARP